MGQQRLRLFPAAPEDEGIAPFSRSTRFPDLASSTSFSEMSCCLAEGLPPRLPA